PDEQLFTGSENFSTASLSRNRELGIRSADRTVISAISAAIAGDYAGATSGGSSSGGSSPSPAPAESTGAAPGQCGARANPFGLTLCASAQLVYSPPSGVCDYFHCISSFAGGKGYTIECKDGTYSKSGGRDGVCNGHRGPGHPVRKN